jgi:uncharacterized protein YggE
MFSRSFITRLAVFALLLAFTAGCAAQPVASASVDKSSAAVTSVSGVSSVSSAPSSQTTTSSGGGITVVGTGTATGTPDQANVSIGVQTQSTTAQQAVSDNQAQMNILLSALKDLGIADKDMRTSNYSVYTENQPSQTNPDGKPASGSVIYHVSNQVDVTIRDISKLGDLLDKAVTSGANSIYGVSFSVADPSKLEGQARAAAVKDAKDRAESIASLEGLSLSSVISISEVSAAPGPLYNAAVGMGGGGTPIQPGEMTIAVSITVTYSIK